MFQILLKLKKFWYIRTNCHEIASAVGRPSYFIINHAVIYWLDTECYESSALLVILHVKIYCFTGDFTYAQILNDLLLSFVVGEFSDKK